jgi:TetR/AcrR family fatty acid metabolism transcriptional regulator
MRSEIEAGADDRRSFIETARRAQIIECAIETIAALGYAKASLAQIARRAGISKGVISYHFAGKDELIQQIVAELYSAADAFIRPRVMVAVTAGAKLRAYIESNLEFISAHRTHLIALTEIFLNLRAGQHLERAELAPDERAVAEVERLLRRGQREGEFGEFSPRVMAITIRRAIDAIAPQLINDPRLDLESYAHELAAIFDRAARRSA